MAKGISIGVAGDASEFASAVKKGVIAPLEDADDAVKEIGKDASRLGELETNMTDAQKATSKYERELQDAIDAQKKAARGAREFGDDSKQSFHEAGQNVEEFKDEARSNFSEVVSSFDGSMSSVADLAQGTLGGLAGSIAGPIGLAAGLGAAALGGIFTSMTQSAEENAELTKQRVSDMFDDMIESGNRFLSADIINSKIAEIVKDSEQLSKVQDRATAAGVSIQTALRAEAGDKEALATVTDALNAANERLIESGDKSATSIGHTIIDRALDYYNGLSSSVDTAAHAVDVYTQSTTNTSSAMSNATVKAQGLRATLDALPTSKHMTVDVDVDGAIRQLDRISQRSLDIVVTGHTRAGDRVF